MPGAARVRFVADAMLGSLARKLRILGFDTTYYKSGDDAGIIDQAVEGGRVILTADGSLATLTGRRGARAIRIAGRNDAARLRGLKESAETLGIGLGRGEPLCSICNGQLALVPKSEARGHVPTSVASRHRLFYKCKSCGKFYWKGGHWKKLRSYQRLLRET